MENMKYIGFYTLLLFVVLIGVLQWSWLLVFPAALVLAGAYIAVKGKDWKQVMGKNELNGSVVFIAVIFSQLVIAALFYGVGRLIAMLLL